MRVIVKPSEAEGKVLVIAELSLMEYFEARRGADIVYRCTSGRVASPLARFIGESIAYLRGIRHCGSV
ncbi:hypothetical protein B7L70_09670 [Vulcanisaeta sp. EB80]|uniref:hypothetical protein n=1 Tax=Vulcanisaeta sp. EB80 TaxID=1650660 RepID=UPI0009C0B11B|nr:hypothetical protein [Vulcanisaeta sp. EB80]PLC66895.1 hypothetical protein B7L70_09670 [Vulcanisaeta sp. EB80]